jgi:hypothetical protein
LKIALRRWQNEALLQFAECKQLNQILDAPAEDEMLARDVHYDRRANCSLIDDVPDRGHTDASGGNSVQHLISGDAGKFVRSCDCRKRLHNYWIEGKFGSECSEPACRQAGESAAALQ